MTHKLEYCTGNATLGSAALAQSLQAEFPRLQVKAWDCLGYCHRCFRVPFLLLDERHVLEAATIAELEAKVRMALQAIE